MIQQRDKTTPTFFNTATRKKEKIKKPEGRPLLLYTCGPTVYHYAHIGNFRTYVFEDLLRRALKFFGFPLKQVMNITDVDDKTIRGATAQGCSLKAFTKPFEEAFFEDLQALSIEPAESYPAATDYIPQMITLIETLIERNVAYVGGDGSVYFAIAKFPHYGGLSHLKLDELIVGASERVAADEYDKEHLADFVLWKSYDPKRDGAIFWESPFGRGRPGWHLECSAMAMSLLGETIDIHCGGIDNIFPHHENEIAQSEAATGHAFVRHWMHADHLVVDQRKMSKSLGNVYTLRDLAARGYSGREVRYMLLHTHYRSSLNFTFEGMEAVRSTLGRLDHFVGRIEAIKQGKGDGLAPPACARALDFFELALADDLNISAALAALFDLVREINAFADQEQVGREDAEEVLRTLREMDSVLAILSFDLQEEIPEEMHALLKAREEARRHKEWEQADQLRDLIHQKGFVIEDTPQGARLKRK